MDYIIFSGSRSTRHSHRFSFIARVLTVLIVLSMAGCATVAFAEEDQNSTVRAEPVAPARLVLP